MKKEINVVAPPPKQYTGAVTVLLAQVVISNLSKTCTYEQIDKAIERCEEELRKQQTL